MYDAFCKQISTHELKHCFNGDESRRGSTHNVHGRISVFSNKTKTKQKQSKQHGSTLTTLKHAQAHFIAEQNLYFNFETMHRARAVTLKIANSGNFRGYQTSSRETLKECRDDQTPSTPFLTRYIYRVTNQNKKCRLKSK